MSRGSLQLSPTPFFFIFGVSGFSGLIYESIWTHYIKLFLGNAAYAQTLVLAIFMGGLAAGSWIAARWSSGWRNPLVIYAWVEAAVGVAAIVFHRVFVASTDYSYDVIIPALGSPETVQAWKWSLSALLILPQSVLLGMTFPLMSSGVIRHWPITPGKSLAMLYFSNSIGAALGVLTSGFYLIGKFGLPGTMLTAGFINIVLALIVWLLTRDQPASTNAKPPPTSRSFSSRRWVLGMLFAAAITGAASFIYEIAWIRLLSLVLGSSTHSFELMLSAFILGLALGGLWVRRKIDALDHPIRFLGYIQLVMGLLALATLPLYGKSFDLMQLFLTALSRTPAGYQVFQFASHLICLLIMLPATICAGMTLPLITYTLMKRGEGEKAIGAVYGANTIGSILGVLLAVNVLMPLVGAKGLLTVGALFDLALGMVLLWAAVTRRRFEFSAVAVAVSALFALTSTLGRLDPLKLASGVYRSGIASLPAGTKVPVYRDGKTATVALLQDPSGIMTIVTNGKADAQLNLGAGPPTADEPTMVLAGALALAANPTARIAANIGMGSGLTAHTLLSSSQLARVDTIEIEAEMVSAARGFGERVQNTFNDPRSHIFVDDAKAFFSTRQEAYDIIVSEPSNPWVSGVASLFSREFYARIGKHLAPAGVFVQWVQLYEIDAELVASMMTALSSEFSDYVVYNATDGDMLILARKHGNFAALSPQFLHFSGLDKELQRVGVLEMRDIEARRLGDKRTLDPMFRSFGTPVNSDYFPFLDQNAARTRFMNSNGADLTFLSINALPVLEMLAPTNQKPLHGELSHTPAFSRATLDAAARTLQKAIVERRYADFPTAASPAMLLPHLFVEVCDNATAAELWIDTLLDLATFTLPHLAAAELEPMWDRIDASKCFSRLSPDQKEWLMLVRAVSRRDADAMADLTQKILEKKPDVKHKNRLRYAIRAGMLGNLVKGKPLEVSAIWNRYGAPAFALDKPPLDVRLMLALSAPQAYAEWRRPPKIAEAVR